MPGLPDPCAISIRITIELTFGYAWFAPCILDIGSRLLDLWFQVSLPTTQEVTVIKQSRFLSPNIDINIGTLLGGAVKSIRYTFSTARIRNAGRGT